MQTATNPETGETVVLINGDWKKADSVATNDAGEKAYLLGGKWESDSATAKPKEAAKRTEPQKAGRAIGMTARAAVKGAMALPLMGADALAGVVNTVAGTQLDPSGAFNRYLTKFGLPEPENATERVVQDVAGAMAGTGGIWLAAKAAKPARKENKSTPARAATKGSATRSSAKKGSSAKKVAKKPAKKGSR